MSHDGGQSPAVSEPNDRFRRFAANFEAGGDVSGDCPQTRPEEAA